jgi:hypothetical protein
VHPRFRHFARFFPEKRLELKSLKGQTKAEELGDQVPELLSLRQLYFEPSLREKLGQNLQLKTPLANLKNRIAVLRSPEPQTA